MTEIEQKALALVNEARVQDGMFPFKMGAKMDASNYTFTALCRAIEQHEAFRREVSDAVRIYRGWLSGAPISTRHTQALARLDSFIIPEPVVDPLVEVMGSLEMVEGLATDAATALRAAMKARGYEFTKIGEAGE